VIAHAMVKNPPKASKQANRALPAACLIVDFFCMSAPTPPGAIPDDSFGGVGNLSVVNAARLMAN
jgi:hypothetical protein